MKIFKFLFMILLIPSIGKSQVAKTKLFHEPGIYLGSNWSQDTKINFVPQAWLYVNDFYVEARYNYEDEKTFSVNLGKTIEIAELRMDVTPTVGLVFGNFKGYALGLNTEYSTKTIAGFAENEYCFSSINTNFFFSWAGIMTPVIKKFTAGVSWQYTLEPFSSVFDVGPMLSYKKNIFEFQLFAYNPWNEKRYWQLGVSLEFGAKD